MNNKLKSPAGLNPGGVGPKIFRNTMPSLILAIIAGIIFPDICSFPIPYRNIVRIVGWVVLALGITTYLLIMKKFLKGFSKGKLITEGIFSLSRNPLYSSWILFILPAIALVSDNWTFLFSIVAMYIFFRLNIIKEEESLFQIFGEEYLKYKQKVNCLIFWPHFK
jgi:protein-S-isoprenylcysteine O-methyltransferase Ste14